MQVTTILSRHTRAKAKTLTVEQLQVELEQCKKMAITWMGIPNGHQQANKYWDGVSFYENLIEKHAK